MKLFTYTQVGEREGCRARDISDLVYTREIDPADLVQIGMRRFVPEKLLPKIREILAAKGKLKPELIAR